MKGGIPQVDSIFLRKDAELSLGEETNENPANKIFDTPDSVDFTPEHEANKDDSDKAVFFFSRDIFRFAPDTFWKSARDF